MVYIEDILKEGIYQGASDIHIVQGHRPLLRVNKILKTLDDFDIIDHDDVYEYFRYFVKDNPQLVSAYQSERRLDINFSYNGTKLRINVSSVMGDFTFTIRIIQTKLPSFESLHLPSVLRHLANLPQGLILITGKSNSGKSTTLNVIIDELNHSQSKKILTLENPIEYVHTSDKALIVQKEVGVGKDFNSFYEGAYNALREDCDILIVGEIRDKDTMEAAIEMAESGHLVFGTMHTRSCSETVDRIIHFYQPEEQANIKNVMSLLLVAVITQRLLPSPSGTLELIPEVMIVDDIISAFIRKEQFNKTEIEDAIVTKMEKGSISLLYSLARAVQEGRITIEQAELQIPPEKLADLYKIIRQWR